MNTVKGPRAALGRILFFMIIIALLSACSGGAKIKDDPVRLAVSSELEESGILDELLPEFTRLTGWVVEVTPAEPESAVALGVQALADALLINSPEAEMEFIEGSHGSARTPVMFFVSLKDAEHSSTNQYSILIVNPEKDEGINLRGATDLKEWIIGRKAQSIIGNYKADDIGGCPFVPNAPMPSRAPV